MHLLHILCVIITICIDVIVILSVSTESRMAQYHGYGYYAEPCEMQELRATDSSRILFERHRKHGDGLTGLDGSHKHATFFSGRVSHIIVVYFHCPSVLSFSEGFAAFVEASPDVAVLLHWMVNGTDGF